jgi:hypothetical protein
MSSRKHETVPDTDLEMGNPSITNPLILATYPACTIELDNS